MKCILIVSGSPALQLGQVLDRPYMQHAVEQLVGRGVTSLKLLVQEQNYEVGKLLGDGSRWGVQVEYMFTETEPSWHHVVACDEPDSAGLVLVGDACRLPFLPFPGNEGSLDGACATVYFEENEGLAQWTGWILVNPSDLHAFSSRIDEGCEWREALRKSNVQASKVFLEHPSLSCSTPDAILQSNRAALEGAFPGLFFTGKEIRPGIWVARAAKLPASVKLQAPCYIGEESWLGANCNLGPHAVIGPRCVIAGGTEVTRSVIAEATYLGPELEISDSYVAQDSIHNVRIGAEVRITEPHVAGSLVRKQTLSFWQR